MTDDKKFLDQIYEKIISSEPPEDAGSWRDAEGNIYMVHSEKDDVLRMYRRSPGGAWEEFEAN